MSTQDQVLLSEIQYAVVEPPDGGASWPSGLWRRDEVLAALNHSQDKFLKETLSLLKVTTLTGIAVGQHRVTLPTGWLRTMTVVWQGTSGLVKELQRSDAFEADHLIPTWQLTNGTPQIYMEDDSPSTLEVQIAPGPDETGTIELLFLPQGTELAGNGQSLFVPDEWRDGVKYGALGTMLNKDGRGRDPARAGYCDQRVQLMVTAAKLILEGWA